MSSISSSPSPSPSILILRELRARATRILAHPARSELGVLRRAAEKVITYVNHVPQELRTRKQFLPRFGKLPYRRGEIGWIRDGWDNPAHWMSFESALEALLQKPELFDGISFVCKRADSENGTQIVAGDLDCCVDPGSGAVTRWAREVLERIRPFYTELSPSRTGIRFFAMGELPGSEPMLSLESAEELDADLRERIKRAKDDYDRSHRVKQRGERKAADIKQKLELFVSNKQVTLTGWKISEFCYPPEDRTGAIRELLNHDHGHAQEITRALESVRHSGKAWLSEKAPIRIEDVIDTRGFERTGDQLAGPHPVHGSTTGQN
ncbi:MAG: hypothetical protein N3G75_09235, partial [Methanothrix sp.]